MVIVQSDQTLDRAAHVQVVQTVPTGVCSVGSAKQTPVVGPVKSTTIPDVPLRSTGYEIGVLCLSVMVVLIAMVCFR